MVDKRSEEILVGMTGWKIKCKLSDPAELSGQFLKTINMKFERKL